MATTEWLTAMADLDTDGLEAFLRAHSGLPGPRANLALADAFSESAPTDAILRFADSSDEFVRFCGTQALGTLVARGPVNRHPRALLLTRASDPLWRVREAVSRALQIIAAANPALMREIVREWIASDEPLVIRAAVAAICEPRLLKDADNAALALRTCDVATEALLRLRTRSGDRERERVLRQALGYAWSVAIAASPATGVPAFRRLAASDDPDIRWIVTSNAKKARLRRVAAELGSEA